MSRVEMSAVPFVCSEKALLKQKETYPEISWISAARSLQMHREMLYADSSDSVDKGTLPALSAAVPKSIAAVDIPRSASDQRDPELVRDSVWYELLTI